MDCTWLCIVCQNRWVCLWTHLLWPSNTLSCTSLWLYTLWLYWVLKRMIISYGFYSRCFSILYVLRAALQSRPEGFISLSALYYTLTAQITMTNGLNFYRWCCFLCTPVKGATCALEIKPLGERLHFWDKLRVNISCPRAPLEPFSNGSSVLSSSAGLYWLRSRSLIQHSVSECGWELYS